MSKNLQKGIDSLAGRYFLFHLWSFTISELGKRSREIGPFLNDPLQISMEQANELKEIWSRRRMSAYCRWSNIYSQQLIREDIRDLTVVKSVVDVETFYLLLPSKVGSPISAPSLSHDLKVSYNCVRSWLSVFERFFLTFSIGPWTGELHDNSKKRKVYLWDAPRIPAIQLVEENESYRMIPNGNQYILVAPAYQWLSNLP
jgi:predicted AAA+ superfamily ATPase